VRALYFEEPELGWINGISVVRCLPLAITISTTVLVGSSTVWG